jgi:inorganic pyrophosphatase
MIDYYRLPNGKNIPDVFNVVVEIPRGSRNKYEYNTELNVFQLDRVLASPMYYDFDYGFVPQTLAGDGDAVDALVMMDEPSFCGCIIEVRPLGMMKMEDGGEDFKILCVPTGDKRYNDYHSLDDVPAHKLKEIEHFFASYKTLENKFPEVNGWEPVEVAKKYIVECQKTFTATYAAKV